MTLVLVGFWAFGVAGGLFAGWCIWSDTKPEPGEDPYDPMEHEVR